MTDEKHICDYPACSVRGSGHPLACGCRSPYVRTSEQRQKDFRRYLISLVICFVATAFAVFGILVADRSVWAFVEVATGAVLALAWKRAL